MWSFSFFMYIFYLIRKSSPSCNKIKCNINVICPDEPLGMGSIGIFRHFIMYIPVLTSTLYSGIMFPVPQDMGVWWKNIKIFYIKWQKERNRYVVNNR